MSETALDVLEEHLPTIFRNPLPRSVLNEKITLRLFPSTHPHLPVVHGHTAYGIGLRSSPIAWNRLPFTDERLQILSVRMISSQGSDIHAPINASGEQLIVRWRTSSKKKAEDSEAAADLDLVHKAPVGMSEAIGSAEEFTGLFIFDFDREGLILRHTIEHVEQRGRWEKGLGTQVVHLTDRILGGMNGAEGTEPV